MFKKAVLTATILTVFLSANGCRQGDIEQSIIKGIDVQTHSENGNTFVELDAIVKIGELKLPHLEVPIYHPETHADIGTLSMDSLQDGTNRVGVEINYTAVSNSDPKLGATLPNNRELPGALGATQLVGIPVLEQSRIYVGGDLEKEIIIGAAIGIPALDNAVNQLPIPLNLFMGFPFSVDVYGVGGMYTSTEKGKSGVGIFAKKSMTQNAQMQIYRMPASDRKISEIEKLDRITKFKLGRLINTNRTLKIK